MALFDHGSVYMPPDDMTRWSVGTWSLAHSLGLSQGYIARLCRAGAIAARKAGGQWAIEREEAERVEELRKGTVRLKYNPPDYSSIVDYWVPFGVGFAPLGDHWHYQRGEAGAEPPA